MNRRRNYINRQHTHCDQLHSCTWCGRNMVDVLEIRGTGTGEMLYECVNRRACMKERTIQAIAARDARVAAQPDTTSISCHDEGFFDGECDSRPAAAQQAPKPAANDAPRCQVCHRRDHRPGDMNAGHAYASAAGGPLTGLVAAWDTEAARMRATMGDQAAATIGQGTLFGQGELFGDGAQ